VGGSSSRLGGSPPSYAFVVWGDVVSHVKYGFDSGLRVSHVDLRGLHLFPESWCREDDDRHVAVNCFEMETQPHGLTEWSASWFPRFSVCSNGLVIASPTGEAVKRERGR